MDQFLWIFKTSKFVAEPSDLRFVIMILKSSWWKNNQKGCNVKWILFVRCSKFVWNDLSKYHYTFIYFYKIEYIYPWVFRIILNWRWILNTLLILMKKIKQKILTRHLQVCRPCESQRERTALCQSARQFHCWLRPRHSTLVGSLHAFRSLWNPILVIWISWNEQTHIVKKRCKQSTSSFLKERKSDENFP